MKGQEISILKSKLVRFFICAMIISLLCFLHSCSYMQKKAYRDYSVKPLDPQIDKECVFDPKGEKFAPQKTKDCIVSRNSQVFEWLVKSDELCENHMKTIYGNEAAYNIFFGTMTNIFAGLGVVLTDPATKTAMAASALFSNSERSLINESVYKTVIVSSIVKKIRDDREKRKATIIDNLKDPNLSYEKYPINFAVADIQEYHYHCSFMYGLQKALEEGTQDTTPQKILQLKRDLEEVKQGIKIRAMEIGKKTGEELTAKDMDSDYFLKQLKDRHDALNKELASLQSSMTPSTTKTSPTGTSDTKQPKDEAGNASKEDQSKEVGTQPSPEKPGK